MSDESIVEQCVEALRSLNFAQHIRFKPRRGECVGRSPVDGQVEIDGDWGQQISRVEVKPRLSTQNINAVIHHLESNFRASGTPALLMSRRISDSIGEILRSHGIDYVDMAGNASINREPLRLWISGRKAPRGMQESGRSHGLAYYKIAGYLLSAPKVVDESYRLIAQQADVSLGSVSIVIKQLTRESFIAQSAGGRKLIRTSELLESWVNGFNELQRPHLLVKRFRPSPEFDIQQIALHEAGGYAIGGELGADILTHHMVPRSAVLYRMDMSFDIAAAMRLVPDREGTIGLFDTPGPWALEWEEKQKYQSVAHPLLIYADLLCEKYDSRLGETARLIRDKYLGYLTK